MVNWVLIILLYSDQGVAMHDFDNEQSCKNAAQTVQKADVSGMTGGNGVTVLCVKR